MVSRCLTRVTGRSIFHRLCIKPARSAMIGVPALVHEGIVCSSISKKRSRPGTSSARPYSSETLGFPLEASKTADVDVPESREFRCACLKSCGSLKWFSIKGGNHAIVQHQ